MKYTLVKTWIVAPLLLANLVAMCLPMRAALNDAHGEVRLSPVFGSNMVLQRDVPAKIFGWANAGETVVVKLGDQVVGKTVGAGTNFWSVTLPVLKAGPLPDITVAGKNTITLTNLLAGDVWVCAGQSNMDHTLAPGEWCKHGGVLDTEQEVAAANHPRIRLFNLASKQPWRECTSESAKRFSAAGYFFGRELHQQLNVPIGLVVAAVGGTPAEYWTPLAARKASPAYLAALEAAKGVPKELRAQFTADNKAMTEWWKAADQAKKNGLPVPPRPTLKLTKEQENQARAANSAKTVGVGYASRVKPLTVMAIKGVIWYQGESNANRAAEYAELLTQLIGGWRKDWGQSDFPFLIMQLVNFNAHTETWPALRAAQQAVADTVPNTGLAVGIDIGDPDNIHPKDKKQVGHRLALVALKQVYGVDVVAAGPKPIGARFESGKVVLSFDQRLVFKPGSDTGFELAGKDGKFQPATAEAHDTTLSLTATSVPAPSAMRYAWQDNPPATVFNTAGLPSAPFQKNATGERMK